MPPKGSKRGPDGKWHMPPEPSQQSATAQPKRPREVATTTQEPPAHLTKHSADEAAIARVVIDSTIPKTFCVLMKQALPLIDTTAYAVSCGGECSTLSMPGLCLKGTDVKLPLTGDDVKHCAKEGTQSPFGLGNDTIVDTSVRQSLEFKPEDVTIKNPRWNSSLNEVVKSACKGLRMPDDQIPHVEASLWRVLYYAKGSFFKPHKDTEKVPGMFATLVITLPSEYKGGDLVCTHHGKTVAHRFGSEDTRSFSANYACFFADVTHEVKPVTSGARLVMTYNLSWNCATKPMPCLSIPPQAKALAREAAKHLESTMYFGLEHDYSDGTVSKLGVKQRP